MLHLKSVPYTDYSLSYIINSHTVTFDQFEPLSPYPIAFVSVKSNVWPYSYLLLETLGNIFWAALLRLQYYKYYKPEWEFHQGWARMKSVSVPPEPLNWNNLKSLPCPVCNLPCFSCNSMGAPIKGINRWIKARNCTLIFMLFNIRGTDIRSIETRLSGPGVQTGHQTLIYTKPFILFPQSECFPSDSTTYIQIGSNLQEPTCT